jgi:hypothetical protein
VFAVDFGDLHVIEIVPRVGVIVGHEIHCLNDPHTENEIDEPTFDDVGVRGGLRRGRPEVLTDQSLFVLSAEERAQLDPGDPAAYERAGITTDPRTHARPAPVLGDIRLADGRTG